MKFLVRLLFVPVNTTFFGFKKVIRGRAWRYWVPLHSSQIELLNELFSSNHLHMHELKWRLCDTRSGSNIEIYFKICECRIQISRQQWLSPGGGGGGGGGGGYQRIMFPNRIEFGHSHLSRIKWNVLHPLLLSRPNPSRLSVKESPSLQPPLPKNGLLQESGNVNSLMYPR